MNKTLIAIGIGAVLLSCGNKEEGADKPPKEAPETAYQWKKVGGLGLEAEVAVGTKIDDNTKTAGFPRATLWTMPTLFVTGQNDLFWEADVAAAKADVQKDPNKFQRFTKEEASGDGFHLEYTLEAMIDKKPLYGVKIRRKIAGALFDCGTNSSSEAERAKAIKICQSLRAAQ